MGAGVLNLSLSGDKLLLGGYGNFLPADPVQLAAQVETFRYILCAVYAWLAWEHIVTFFEEVQRWKQLILKREVVLVNICVLVSRYLSWTNAIASAVFFFSNPFSCQATFSWIFATYALVWGTTATIFVARVNSLYPAKRRLHIFVWACFALVAVLWAVSVGFFWSARLPEEYRLPRMPQCTAAPSPTFHVMGFAGATCFDILVLVLTVHSARKNFRGHKRSGIMSPQTWVLETAVIYAAVCLACNIAQLSVWLLQKNVVLRAYPIPFAIVVNPVIASRIVFHGATWGSKTALLESRLVKITEDDVANWQRNPGVLGAAPSTTVKLPAKRFSATVSVPTAGAPMGGHSRSGSISGDTMYEKSGAFDERLGFNTLFVRSGSVARKEDALEEVTTPAAQPQGSAPPFSDPFNAVTPPEPVVIRRNTGTALHLPGSSQGSSSSLTSTPQSVAAPTLSAFEDEDDADVGPRGERRDGPPRVRLAPLGWEIQGLENAAPASAADDVEQAIARQPPQFSDRPVFRPPAPGRSPRNRAASVASDRGGVKISQHVTTRID